MVRSRGRFFQVNSGKLELCRRATGYKRRIQVVNGHLRTAHLPGKVNISSSVVSHVFFVHGLPLVVLLVSQLINVLTTERNTAVMQTKRRRSKRNER